jgi:hypothetical protein
MPNVDYEVAGRAQCGCVYHAEEGVPCVHDLELVAHREVLERL